MFPWLEDITENSNVYLFLFVGSLLRLYLPLRSLFYRSALNSNSARFIASLSGIPFGSTFVVRAYVHLYPVTTTSLATGINFLLTSYIFRTFESVGCYESRACGPVNLADSMWIVAITMVRVGYGAGSRYVPMSSPGKLIMVFLGSVGVLLVLVNVALALISLQLLDSEEFVLHTWRRLKNKSREKFVAVRAMQVGGFWLGFACVALSPLP